MLLPLHPQWFALLLNVLNPPPPPPPTNKKRRWPTQTHTKKKKISMMKCKLRRRTFEECCKKRKSARFVVRQQKRLHGHATIVSVVVCGAQCLYVTKTRLRSELILYVCMFATKGWRQTGCETQPLNHSWKRFGWQEKDLEVGWPIQKGCHDNGRFFDTLGFYLSVSYHSLTTGNVRWQWRPIGTRCMCRS